MLSHSGWWAEKLSSPDDFLSQAYPIVQQYSLKTAEFLLLHNKFILWEWLFTNIQS